MAKKTKSQKKAKPSKTCPAPTSAPIAPVAPITSEKLSASDRAKKAWETIRANRAAGIPAKTAVAKQQAEGELTKRLEAWLETEPVVEIKGLRQLQHR